MLSSTSNSDRPAGRGGLNRFTVVLISTVLAMLAVAEVMTITAFDRVSRVQRREVTQRENLLRVNDAPAADLPHVAVLGNSLLLEGVDVGLLESKLQSKLAPAPYFVLATTYYDWLFGLKRLFAEGMRPRYVVVGLSPSQFASTSTRGDYAARYLFRGSDLVDVVKATKMDATSASGFLLSHFSKYYSTRVVTRGFVLGRVMPSVDELLHSFAGRPRAPELPADALRALARERLQALEQLCEENGAQLVFVIPPTFEKGTEAITQAGRDRQVPVLAPVADNELDGSYFQKDGFHLNERGAKVFTARLASNLLEVLSE